MNGAELKVSVVIPTYNRAESVERLLFALQAQKNAPPFEVVVVNDGSTDDTSRRVKEAAGSFPVPLRLINLDHRGVAAARNAGLAAARAEIVAFTDDDCAPAEDWLGRLTAALEAEAGLVGVGGFTQPAPPGRLILDYYAAYGVIARPGFQGNEVIYLITCNAAFRKAALLAAGGFDPAQNPAGEDVAISEALRRGGGRLAFEPAAVVNHYHHPRFGSFLRTQFNYGRGEMIRLRFDPPFWKILRLLYRSRQFLFWLLLPLDWISAAARPDLTPRQKVFFPLLEHLRQTLLVLGQWRELRHLFTRPVRSTRP